MAFVWLIVCAAAIYLSCEWFVNAVEWLGHRLRLGAMAVGTVLAAFGTALPESVVTFVAVVFGHSPAQKDVGVGAALGGPLVLATIAYGIVGVLLWVRARRPATAAYDAGDLGKLRRDQVWFLAIFLVKVALGLVTFAIKPWLGGLFFLAYAAYFWKEVRESGVDGAGKRGERSEVSVEGDRMDGEADLEPLKLQPRRAAPSMAAILLQTGATLAVIFVASQAFVRQLDVVGPRLGLPATVTALLLAPVATELPEILNAVIWVRQGKTALALANISGSMMIQATVPSGLGILFTPWEFDGPLILAGAVTVIAIGYLLMLLRRGQFTPGRLAVATLFYAIFALGVPLLV